MGYGVNSMECNVILSVEKYNEMIENNDDINDGDFDWSEVVENDKVVDMSLSSVNSDSYSWVKETFDDIAKYANDGSYIIFYGEDGEIWKVVFRNGAYTEHNLVKMIFDEEEE